ncbi:hypothetical protein ACFL3S_08605 [Gemmatimonadota bacterium]
MRYLHVGKLAKATRSYLDEGDLSFAEQVYEAAHLGVWLRRHLERPQPDARDVPKGPVPGLGGEAGF